MNIKTTLLYAFCVFLLSCNVKKDNNWEMYRGGPESNSYSSLKEINVNNVSQLKIAWTYHTGDEGPAIECNPIIIDGVMFITSPALKVMALNAATGKLIWKFDPFAETKAKGVNRGVTFWQEGTDKRIFFAAANNLYALNAETGLLVTSFGNKGIVDLRIGLNRNPNKISVIMSSPGIIYKNYLIVGSGVSEK